MKINLTPMLKQRVILGSNMQQSVEVLQLSLTDLTQAINHELQENPLLEAEEPITPEDSIDRIIQQRYEKHMTAIEGYSFQESLNQDSDAYEERPFAKTVSLEEHLLRQLKLEITDPFKIQIGEFIISHLNDDGYLNCTLEDIAHSLKMNDLAQIEEILIIIQHFEPLGIASRDLKECLTIQIHHRFNGEGASLIKLVNNHLEDLSHKRFHELAKKLNVSPEQVKLMIQKIANLEPKPARNFRPLKSNIYVKPDITITQTDDEKYHITIHKEYIPTLRINKTYQQLLYDPGRCAEEKKFVSDKIKLALSFIKSIDQRHSTLRQVAEYILNYQREFFDQGPLHLKPMTLKDIAEHIERNESTVCRAISDKYVQTPHGLFPLKYFFAQAIADSNGGSVSSRSVKEEIKVMIENENTTKPLSDQEIYEHLSKRGMNLSRRTVAKYRQTLRILPSHLRKV